MRNVLVRGQDQQLIATLHDVCISCSTRRGGGAAVRQGRNLQVPPLQDSATLLAAHTGASRRGQRGGAWGKGGLTLLLGNQAFGAAAALSG